ncbi:MAG: hypothetical protein LBF37_00610 [Rickettsiales bacterium]|jgi:hypothetical protein|nr:hypothetical protein [Rickettsiales bacterium]
MNTCANNEARVAQGKAQPDYSFLEPFFDKAFRIVRRNYAAPGSDNISIKDIKQNYRGFKSRLLHYNIQSGEKHNITDYTGEIREINKYSILDIWLQTALRLYIEYKTDYRPKSYVFSYRKTNGEYIIKDFIKSWNSDKVLYIDIANFYKDISREFLIDRIKMFLQKNEIDIFEALAWNGSMTGLPVGNSMSVLLSNYYLDEIDAKFDNSYARFGDDMFFDLNIYNQQDVINTLEAELKKLNLKINKSKMKIINPTKA